MIPTNMFHEQHHPAYSARTRKTGGSKNLWDQSVACIQLLTGFELAAEVAHVSDQYIPYFSWELHCSKSSV